MKKERYVMVDVGYSGIESLSRAKVIRECFRESLFGGPPEHVLLVELLSGERMWVCEWKEEE